MDEGKKYLSFDNAVFAEVDLESNVRLPSSGESALRFYTTVAPPAQPIAERAADPLRQRFFDMRSLASNKPFARNDSELFYKQAKFMEDFTDDYEGDARLNMYYPYYQHMGYEQLRTYFTWRTKVRQGDIRPTSVSYAFLYVYELLSGVGVDDPLDGLNKLVSLWADLSVFRPLLENYLPRWLKDYHVYYELPHSFEDFVAKHDMKQHYPLSFIFQADAENCLGLWNSLSGYDVTKSKFYIEGNDRLISDCFFAVINGIRDFCLSNDANYMDMIIYRVSNKTPWYPFRQALFYHWLDQADRNVSLPGYERYYCQNNRFTASLPIYFSTQKDFIGYIIKKTESCLRQAVKYKYKLAVGNKPGYGDFRELKELELSNTDLDTVIEKSVAAFHRDLTRTVVTVDHDNLARIRREALGTQDKLVVPEDDIPVPAGADASLYTSNSAFGPDDPWDALKNTLDAIEIRALKSALLGGAGVKAIADESGIMLEVLADGINEKAADCIGDSILEVGDGLEIYDDYKENVKSIVS